MNSFFLIFFFFFCIDVPRKVSVKIKHYIGTINSKLSISFGLKNILIDLKQHSILAKNS